MMLICYNFGKKLIPREQPNQNKEMKIGDLVFILAQDYCCNYYVKFQTCFTGEITCTIFTYTHVIINL